MTADVIDAGDGLPLTIAALLSMPHPWPARDERPAPVATTAPAPPNITGRNWKPVTPDVDVFQLILSVTSWTAVPDQEHPRKHGLLRWNGDRMIVNADPPCTATGTYHVDSTENRLTITAEHDPCTQRRDLLERSWSTLPEGGNPDRRQGNPTRTSRKRP